MDRQNFRKEQQIESLLDKFGFKVKTCSETTIWTSSGSHKKADECAKEIVKTLGKIGVYLHFVEDEDENAMTMEIDFANTERLSFMPTDGYHSVADCLPEPNVMLIIECADNEDSVGGGAATYGTDGKWYWTYDYEISEECPYPVSRWKYMPVA